MKVNHSIKIKKYLDAVKAWKKACDEIDQAHAVLRDIDLHKYHEGSSLYGHSSAEDIHNRAFQLLQELEVLPCEDCGGLVSTHSETECPYWE